MAKSFSAFRGKTGISKGKFGYQNVVGGKVQSVHRTRGGARKAFNQLSKTKHKVSMGKQYAKFKENEAARARKNATHAAVLYNITRQSDAVANVINQKAKNDEMNRNIADRYFNKIEGKPTGNTSTTGNEDSTNNSSSGMAGWL